MTAWRAISGILAGSLAMLGMAGPARADIVDKGEIGFSSRNVVLVKATPDAVWRRLVTPSAWWSSEHTFSGSAANLTIDPVAGGCFCEKLPSDSKAPHAPPRGGVQHMRVVFVDRGKALRMSGALGPLQSEAVNATLTITLKPTEGGTRVLFEYVVGGYMRYPIDKISGAVDAMLGSQLLSLAKAFAPVAEPDKVAVPTVPDKPTADDPAAAPAPQGRVWSLPPKEKPATAEQVDEASVPAVRPLPTPAPARVPPKHRKPVAAETPAPVAAPVPAPAEEVKPAPDATPPPAPAPAAEPKPKPAADKKAKAPTKAAAKKPAASKPVPVKPTGDEPTRDSVNSAFDAALGDDTVTAPKQP